jgi:hypothetical protein
MAYVVDEDTSIVVGGEGEGEDACTGDFEFVCAGIFYELDDLTFSALFNCFTG